MISSESLCMGCMREIGTEKKCPHCGFHVDTVQEPPFLPVRTVVANRYLLGRALERNGEGITYIGWDLTERKAVNIREFSPAAITTRSGLSLNLQVMLGNEAAFAEMRRSFEEMWGKLEKLSGLSALINVTAVFEDYGTSFAVYDHFDGISLRDFLLRSKTGYIPWEKARQLLMPTLSTLGNLHKNGIIHRGISPTTLVIGEDGKIKITGFSIGEVRSAGGKLNPQIFDGYAPIEQYGSDAQQGPWTDIYAFAAVLYRALIGSDPIPARERAVNDRLMVPGKFAESLPAYVINGLINALQIQPNDRTRTVEQLRAELSASPVATASGEQFNRQQAINKTAGTPAPAKKKKKMKPAAIIGITAGVIALAGIAIFAALMLTVFKDRIVVPGKETTTVEQDAELTAVPNFLGRSYYDIESNPVFNSNFKIKSQEIYSDDVNAGYVITQSIDPDTMVGKGTEITLYVSKGKEKVVLPYVVGAKFEEASARLTELGFEVVKSETTVGNYADGEVIMVSLTENQKYDVGTKVTLKVYVSPTTTTAEQVAPATQPSWDEPDYNEEDGPVQTYEELEPMYDTGDE